MPNARLVSRVELVRGVEAADVEGGVGLGVALGLRLGQHVGEGAMLLLHLRQDVVAGAVQDAVHAPDLVAGQRLAQRLDDRDAAGHRRLEIEGDAVLLGELGKLGAMLGEQRLVGGDDVLAGCRAPPLPQPWRPRPRRRSARRTRRSTDRRRAAPGSSNQSMPSSATARFLVRERAETPTTSMLRPALRASRPPCSAKSCSSPVAHRAEPGDAQFQRLIHADCRLD